MRSFLFRLASNALALYIAAVLLDGVEWNESIWSLVLMGVILAIANAIVKPILTLLSLPLVLVTLGGFLLVINTVVLLLSAELVSGFTFASFWAGFLTVLVMFVINTLISWIFDVDSKGRGSHRGDEGERG